MEIATTRVSSRGQIVIPVKMRSDFKEGDNLLIIKRGKELIIKKEEEVSSTFADQALLAQDWLSKEDEEAFAYLQKK
jgi:AbrB family looped-hinge helix DNA binding protein